MGLSTLIFFFLFFPPRFCPGHISGTVTHRDSKLSVLLGPAVLILHCCLPPNSLRYFFFFRHNFFFPATIFFFSATILSGPFASLISSLINIISLLLTTFDWTKVRGIAPRSHTGRLRTCLVIPSVFPAAIEVWHFLFLNSRLIDIFFVV